ncbi:MAG: hypothetical protein E6K53_05260 [Gammaproteobacteria bacterium]|nr:MAG: hypothetical protein E6K53_05260 [Gammaproteobacteria bacterium]
MYRPRPKSRRHRCLRRSPHRRHRLPHRYPHRHSRHRRCRRRAHEVQCSRAGLGAVRGSAALFLITVMAFPWESSRADLKHALCQRFCAARRAS